MLDLLRLILEAAEYVFLGARDGAEGLEAMRSEQPDLVLLDLMLPGIDGLEVCRRLKADAKTRRIAVVMLTAKGEEADIVAGLELGADDYVTKPFSPRVLVARVRAVLRRAQARPESPQVLRVGDLTLDCTAHVAAVAGQSLCS